MMVWLEEFEALACTRRDLEDATLVDLLTSRCDDPSVPRRAGLNHERALFLSLQLKLLRRAPRVKLYLAHHRCYQQIPFDSLYCLTSYGNYEKSRFDEE